MLVVILVSNVLNLRSRGSVNNKKLFPIAGISKTNGHCYRGRGKKVNRDLKYKKTFTPRERIEGETLIALWMYLNKH